MKNLTDIQNLILDVDGTLWNTTPIVADAWNDAITEDGNSKVRVTAKRLMQLFGRPMNVIGDALFTDVSEAVKENLLEECCKYEQKVLHSIDSDILYPNVRRTLVDLVKKQNKRLFIVSNCQSGYIELFMHKNQVEEYITDFECYGNTKLQKGDNIRLLMERNGLSDLNTVYVGDTMGDYEASCAAEIPFIYASYGFGNVTDYAHKINGFEELLSL